MEKNRTRSIIFRLLMLLYIAGVAWLCFANFHKPPEAPKELFGIPMDKIVHFCMFFPFPILAFFAYDRLTETPWQALAALVSICAVGCIFAGITELIQGTLSYRTQDVNDFRADCLAIGISSLLVFIIDVSKMRKKK
ncbi:MAG: VanZ family protein [Bacteroidales bacterium]|nr:VanZ family protein [Bacteroidales bacterium]